MSSSTNHLGLFAKFWEPGRVKTRLAVTLGNQLACELYKTFLFHLLHSIAPAADRATVVFSPPSRKADFQASIPQNWQFEAQTDGDLGDRMRNFFAGRLPATHSKPQARSSEQSTKVVVVGADCPQLTAAEIQNAFDQLDQKDVVIGPSTDGGYYLLGMQGSLAEVFDDIAWSTADVLAQTTQKLDQQRKSYALLPAKTDVDDEDALRQLLADLAAATDTTSATDTHPTLAEKIAAVLPNGRLP